MNAFRTVEWLFTETVVERLGWVLVHSLWQFALVALLTGVIVRNMRRSSAATRHGVLVIALAVSVAVPLGTWMFLQGNVPPDHSFSRSILTVDHGANAAISPEADATRLPSDLNFASHPEPEASTSDHAVPSVASEALRVDSPSNPAVVQSGPSWSEQVATVLRPWLEWIVVGWSLGVALCSLRPLLGWHMLRRLQRVGVSPVSDEVLATMRRVSERLGLRSAVRVLQSTLAQVPVVVGYMRPVILLPVCLMTSIPAAQLEAILAHELAHVQRHDFVVNLLQTLVETLFFYHPAVWWLSHKIRVEREHCCDDLVVELLGNRVEYGRALVAIEELRGRSTVLALGVADGSLLSRVRRLVRVGFDQDVNSPSAAVRLRDRWPFALLSLAFVGLAFALSMSWTVAAKDDAAKEPQPTIAKLPGDVTVELIGVGFHPSKDREWWKGDGSKLEQPPTLKSRFSLIPNSTERDQCREFVVHIRGLSNEPSAITVYEVGNASAYSLADGLWVGETRAGPFKSKTTSIRVGLTTAPYGPTVSLNATGEKQVVAEMPEYLKPFDALISPLGVQEIDGQTELLLAGLPYEALHKSAVWELHAIDVDGQKHRSSSESTPVTGERHVAFKLPLSRIARFEYRLRPYQHWVTFENVSLHPGQKTDVKVTTSHPNADDEAAAERAAWDALDAMTVSVYGKASHQRSLLRHLRQLEKGKFPEKGLIELRQQTRQPIREADFWSVPAEAWPNIGRLVSLRKLSIVGSDVRGKPMEEIGNLRHLHRLVVTNSKCQPQDLVSLNRLTELEQLEVMFTVFDETAAWRQEQVGKLSAAEKELVDRVTAAYPNREHILFAAILTDRSLEHLDDLKRLRSVKLINTFVSNRGVRTVSTLPALEELELSVVDESPDVVRLVGKMRTLKRLSGLSLTDNALAEWSNLTQLEELERIAGGVTDQGVEHLLKFSQLRKAVLWHSQLTDAGLLRLAELPRLESLDVRFSKSLSKTGIDRFQERKPTCKVAHDATANTKVELAPKPESKEPRFASGRKADVTVKVESIESSPPDDARVEAAPKPISFKEAKQLVEGLGGQCNGDSESDEPDARVQLNGKEVDDATIRVLAGYPKLKSLWLFGMVNVTDDGLASLVHCTSLENLQLQAPAVTDVGAKHLARLTKLKYLTLSNTKLTDDGLKHIATLPQLTNFSLWSDNISDAGMQQLARMTSLKDLRSYCPKVTNDGLKMLAQSTILEFLQFSSEHVTDEGVSHLASLKTLSGLGTSNVRLTDESLKAIGTCANLGFLSLSETQITDAGLEHLKGLTKVDRLHFHGNRFLTGEGLSHLRGLPLKQFTLMGPSTSDKGLESLAAFPQITHLAVGFGAQSPRKDEAYLLTDAVLKHLAALPALAYLSIDGAAITDAGVVVLKQASLQNVLCLRCPQITVGGKKIWQTSAPHVQITGDFPEPRAGRGAPIPALDPTASLPNSNVETTPPNNANRDMRPKFAVFPDGRSVEFVGITKNTAPAKDGWKPDGLPLGDDVGYWPSTTVLHSKNSSASYVENGPHPEPDAEAIDLLFRFRGLKAQPSITFDLATNGTSHPLLPVKDPYDIRVSTRRRGELSPGERWTIPEGEMRIGLTDEPWGRYVKIGLDGKVLDPIQPDERYASTYRLFEVLEAKPHDRIPTGTAILMRQPVSQTDPENPLHRYAFEFRAIDTEGNNHWAIEWEGRGIERTQFKESQYGLASPGVPAGKTLSHYEYRVRPYRHWITFTGVSLEPGKESDVKVSVTSLPPERYVVAKLPSVRGGEDDVPARPQAVPGRESFKGRVMIDGAIPQVPPIKVQPGLSLVIPRNDEDQRRNEKAIQDIPVVEIPDDSLVISKEGGLANVAIYLKKAPANWKPSAPPETPVELRSDDNRFQPRVSCLRVGQPLRLIAPKNEVDNLYVQTVRSTPFNRLLVPNSTVDVAKPFDKSETGPIAVGSNLHPWQKAWLFAFDHPFVAITDADGRFEIPDLPAGEHHFTVWHERRGYLNKDLVVRVEHSNVTVVDLKYTVEQLLPVDVAPPIQKPESGYPVVKQNAEGELLPDGWIPCEFGLQYRVRTDTPSLVAGELPLLFVDVRNRGDFKDMGLEMFQGCHAVAVDGQRFVRADTTWGGVTPLEPDGKPLTLAFALSSDWLREREPKMPLRLAQGKHSISLSMMIAPVYPSPDDPQTTPVSRKPIARSLVCRPVEIEIRSGAWSGPHGSLGLENIRREVIAIPEFHSPKVPPNLQRLVQEHQPAAGDFLVKLIKSDAPNLEQAAASVFADAWDSMNQEQIESYLLATMTHSVDQRSQYPQGVDGMIGMGPRHRPGYLGMPPDRKYSAETITTLKLDGVQVDQPIKYPGLGSLSHWVKTKDLSLGRHTLQLATKFTFMRGTETYRGEFKSPEFVFEMVPADTADNLIAPPDEQLNRLVREALLFAETEYELDHPPGRENFNRLTPEPPESEKWRPQIGYGENKFGITNLHAPVWKLTKRLPVDLSFSVEFHVENTDIVIRCNDLVSLAVDGERGSYFSPHDYGMPTEMIKHADKDGFVSGRLVLKPSRAAALTDPKIKRYFGGEITSKPVRFKLSTVKRPDDAEKNPGHEKNN